MANPVEKASQDEAAAQLARTNARLFSGAAGHDMEWISDALANGADIDFVDPTTGLSALQFAVGRNDITLCRHLIEECGATFFPDRFGRWPTVIAAECRVDDALSDYIVEKEAEYLERHGMLDDPVTNT